MRQQYKIPTPLGLVLVAVCVVAVIFGFERLSRIPTKASGSIAPNNIEITNLNDSSLTVTWTTAAPATGQITIKGGKKSETYFDDRDQMGKFGLYSTHSVTARNLEPLTTYTIGIRSNGKPFPLATPLQTTTNPSLSPNSSGLEPAYGQIMTDTSQSGNSPAAGALVYLNLEGSQTLSTLVKPSGSWIIPLNLIRVLDGTSYFSMNQERVTEYLRIHFDDTEGAATTDTLNDSPVPSMVTGKTYDFRKIQAKVSQGTLASASTESKPTPAVLGETSTAQASRALSVGLTTPAQDARLTTNFPLVAGTGIAGKRITITLGITKPTSGVTNVNSDGTWHYTPTKPLTPGKQSVTMTTVDQNNKPVAITHTFEVFKSGTQVLGDATPSATLAPTPTPYLFDTPTPTFILEPIPTSTMSGEPLPTSGNEFPAIIIIIVSGVLIFGGSILFAL